MCGIFGVINHKNSVELVIKNLKKLQYRGYDSCGIAFLNGKDIRLIKTCGTIENLGAVNEKSNMCIGHTRWATHGKVSVENAHPIVDNSNNYFVVHNGIIENYMELKEQLTTEGYTFNTETDTEVIVNLYDYIKAKDIKEKTINLCKMLKGHYAFILYDKKNNSIIVCKNGNPLYLIKQDNTIYISSDIPAICEYGNNIIAMQDKNIAIIKSNKINCYDFNGKTVEFKVKKINLDDIDLSMGKYSHHMLKEIFDTPQSIVNTSIELDNPKLEQISEIITDKKYKRAYLIACGTAFHSCLMARFLLKDILDININCCLASEFRYEKNIIDDNTLCFYVSQSGETADTLLCAKMTKQANCYNISVCNVEGSTLTSFCDFNIITKAGRECAVASTKAYNTQIYTFLEICNYVKTRKKIDKLSLINDTQIILNNYLNLKNHTKNIISYKKLIFIGRNIDYISAKESCLKLKEITYLPCFDLPAGELKHGTLSIVDNDTLVIVINTLPELYDKIDIVINEIKSRGGNVFEVGTRKTAQIRIPVIENKYYNTILTTVNMQLLAYFCALEQGNNPDMPRNLAKSVTVE